MKLIVGLGNPGEKYVSTYHNVGFMAVDWLADKLGGRWKKGRRLESLISRVAYGGQEIILAKPLTYMNRSGRAVSKLLKYFRLLSEELMVIHDDLDLSLGEYRYQFNRGAAGHHGVESIIEALSTKEFYRLRVGICPEEGKPADGEEFVLSRLRADASIHLEEVFSRLPEILFDSSPVSSA